MLCEKDSKQFTHHRLLLSSSEQVHLYGESYVPEASSEDEGQGLLMQLVHLLLSLPRDSIYSFWVAACVHKWVQASNHKEQQFVATVPGRHLEYTIQS